MSDKRWSSSTVASCCTLSNGKHNKTNFPDISYGQLLSIESSVFCLVLGGIHAVNPACLLWSCLPATFNDIPTWPVKSTYFVPGYTWQHSPLDEFPSWFIQSEGGTVHTWRLWEYFEAFHRDISIHTSLGVSLHSHSPRCRENQLLRGKSSERVCMVASYAVAAATAAAAAASTLCHCFDYVGSQFWYIW